ncbi:MAG: hypothetical protein F9K37_12150 [Bacteroidales bacterium]|jgi:hypothetical protein|nr:MAG: hypothetical protein F9K37_12150 [Bacteroidales bacterium]
MNIEVCFWHEVLENLVPFLFGMGASWMLFLGQHHYKLIKKKRFALDYLKNSILTQIPKIQTSLQSAMDAILNNKGDAYKALAYEEFSIYPLSSISPSEYYQIFKQKEFALFHEIYSMIDFLQNNLPNSIINYYFENVNQHLLDVGMVGDKEHIKNCSSCHQLKGKGRKAVYAKKQEFQMLENKINELIDLSK